MYSTADDYCMDYCDAVTLAHYGQLHQIIICFFIPDSNKFPKRKILSAS